MCVCVSQVYEVAFLHSVEYKHLVAWRHFRQNPAVLEYLSSHPAAGPNIQLLSSPVAMETEEQAGLSTSTT